MDLQTRQSYSEVNKFLELIGEEISNKVPLKLREFFKQEMDQSYIPIIKFNIPIIYQGLKRKTIAIIVGLYLQYWYSDQIVKRQLLEIYSNNQKNYENELRERYNLDIALGKNIKK